MYQYSPESVSQPLNIGLPNNWRRVRLPTEQLEVTGLVGVLHSVLSQGHAFQQVKCPYEMWDFHDLKFLQRIVELTEKER